MSIEMKKSNRSKGHEAKPSKTIHSEITAREILVWKSQGKKSIRRSRMQEEKKEARLEPKQRRKKWHMRRNRRQKRRVQEGRSNRRQQSKNCRR